jgi:hypothetical protein
MMGERRTYISINMRGVVMRRKQKPGEKPVIPVNRLNVALLTVLLQR